MTGRVPLAVSLALALLALGGCAARRARLGVDPVAAARPRTTARPGESGYASFGSSVRLRTDTPSLAAVEEEGRRAEAPAPDRPVGADAPAGPAGDPGVTNWYDPWASANAWAAGVSGYGWPGYVPYPGAPAPGGAVPPGLRAPNPLTAPYHAAFPTGDVTYHRPGLSTGTGVHGRDAKDAARASAP